MNEVSLMEPAHAQTWMDSANCLGINPQRMQPDHAARAEVEDIKADVCGPCPVRRECFDLASRQDSAYGIHAGIWWGDEPAWLDYTCQNPACGKEFVREPLRNTRYCSKACRRDAEKAREAAA